MQPTPALATIRQSLGAECFGRCHGRSGNRKNADKEPALTLTAPSSAACEGLISPRNIVSPPLPLSLTTVASRGTNERVLVRPTSWRWCPRLPDVPDDTHLWR